MSRQALVKLLSMGLALAAALPMAGCIDDDVGRLSGALLVVRGCEAGQDVIFEPYDMFGNFFALEQLGDVAFIRMQNGGKPLHRSDAFVVEVAGTEFIRNRLGIAIPIDNPKIRASLSVLGSCPGTSQAMTAHEGSITFHEFGASSGERVRAEFAFQLLDDRTGEVVGLGFSGEMDFEVKVGKPYQPFSGTQ
ncbi:MAG: hypothetical protein ACI9WU_003037 [Myxococcota bacterium]|jgi:hypothetical protein